MPASIPSRTAPPPPPLAFPQDTLLASSWLAQNGLRLDEPSVVPFEARQQLEGLQDSVLLLLQRAITFGTCIVITNAETGWVELSCKKFLPRVLPVLSRLRVLSARSTFEALAPDSPSDWKVHAFHQEIGAAYAGRAPEARRNLISFGDSIHERAAIQRVAQTTESALRKGYAAVAAAAGPGASAQAFHEMQVLTPPSTSGGGGGGSGAGGMPAGSAPGASPPQGGSSSSGALSAMGQAAAGPRVLVKSVKFVERPTLEQLKRQLDLVHSCLGEVVGHAGNLDLMLTISLLFN
jgi:hypothetical protein